MNARKSLFAILGVLALLLAYDVGARRAAADWVGIAPVLGTAGGAIVWNADGRGYQASWYAGDEPD